MPGGALFICLTVLVRFLPPPESIRHLYTLRDAPPPYEAQAPRRGVGALRPGGHAGARLRGGGLTFALIAGVFWALYIRSSAKVGALVPGASGLAVAMLVGAAFIAPVAAVVPAPQPIWNAAQDPMLLLMIFGTAMFASVIPYSAELMALRNLPERVFSVLMSLEPAIAAIAGWALLNQETGPIRWVAIFLLMTASVGITLTTTKGSSHKQKDDGMDPVPVPLPE